MRHILTLCGLLLLSPITASAQSGNIYTLATGLLRLVNLYILPFLISLAVLFFVYNVTRYFVLESDDVEGRTVARTHGFYGVLAIVFIVAFWAIIWFVIEGFGFNAGMDRPIRPDYITS